VKDPRILALSMVSPSDAVGIEIVVSAATGARQRVEHMRRLCTTEVAELAPLAGLLHGILRRDDLGAELADSFARSVAERPDSPETTLRELADGGRTLLDIEVTDVWTNFTTIVAAIADVLTVQLQNVEDAVHGKVVEGSLPPQFNLGRILEHLDSRDIPER
jgi:hypothetical protein